VDCGSNAHDSVAWLEQKGVDVIVLDHHQVSTPPAAVALVNPHLSKGSGSSQMTELCSVALAFKLVHALLKRARELHASWARNADIRTTLDLVALGTIADLVPVVGENRILVTAGLAQLNQTHRPGLCALFKLAQVGNPIGSYEVAFQIAPRLNAAGRLQTALDALDLLMTRELDHADLLAQALEFRNRERQQIERQILSEVISAINSHFHPETSHVIVEGKKEWHIGVVGIVASRIQQEFHRPTIILGGDGPNLRGSGRSVEGFDLARALRECEDILIRHGGHSMAAGVTIAPEHLDTFRDRLNSLAQERLRPEQLTPSIVLEGEVPLQALTLNQVQDLQKLQPCGPKNPVPQFAVCRVTLARPPQVIGRDQQHLKLWITDGVHCLEVLWWAWSGQPTPSGTFDVACVPTINEYNGRCTVQLKLIDWRPATLP
ncbi:MAG: DHHA1 domain-containing protein, partial [Verrucomicrobiae bacterium]|nr:DHHA1 domain-containing protein [Verrucomicrobiae bacterium]